MKELDYEISNGHYALVVTATDQCPNPALRLTSSTTVIMQMRHTLSVIHTQSFRSFMKHKCQTFAGSNVRICCNNFDLWTVGQAKQAIQRHPLGPGNLETAFFAFSDHFIN